MVNCVGVLRLVVLGGLVCGLVWGVVFWLVFLSVWCGIVLCSVG